MNADQVQICAMDKKIRAMQDQIDVLYERLQKVEHKSPVPLYQMTYTFNDKGEVSNRIFISGKPLEEYTKWELAQIIKRQAEQLENIWNQ